MGEKKLKESQWAVVDVLKLWHDYGLDPIMEGTPEVDVKGTINGFWPK